jgi:hypothetical protein
MAELYPVPEYFSASDFSHHEGCKGHRGIWKKAGHKSLLPMFRSSEAHDTKTKGRINDPAFL